VHVAPYALDNAVGGRRADAILTLAHTVVGQTAPAVRTSTERLTERMPHALVDAAETAQLLVVGMGGGSRFDDVLMHSAALDVCAVASCPVAVVRGDFGPQPDGRMVVVGLQDVSSDAAAVTVAFADAQRHHSRLVVMHTVHDGGPVRDLLAGHGDHGDVEREIAGALAPWWSSHPDVQVDVRVVSGVAVGHLLEASTSARLLVVGTHARGPAARMVLGSTSRTVVRLSSCPVMVVRRDARIVESSAAESSATPGRPQGPAPWTLHPRNRSELR
jgi:nucleotide-binding universal stress UspA family protein